MPLWHGGVADYGGSLSVRGRNGITPTSISGLQVWFDSDHAASFTFGVSPKISQWNDRSSNARHVTQGFAGDQPSRNQTYGARTAVRFSGVANVQMFATAVTLAQPYTILAVAARSGGAVGQHVVIGNNGNTSAYLGIGNNALVSIYAGTTVITQGSAPSVDQLQQVTGIFNGASSQAWGNGTAGTAGDAGTAAFELSCVGGLNLTSNHLAGDIAEIVVYNTALSDSNRIAIQNYPNAKWGTP